MFRSNFIKKSAKTKELLPHNIPRPFLYSRTTEHKGLKSAAVVEAGEDERQKGSRICNVKSYFSFPVESWTT